MVAPAVQDQEALELEYRRVSANATLSREEQRAAFGEFERWVLHLDGHRLFLNPYQGEWFAYDRVHDSCQAPLPAP